MLPAELHIAINRFDVCRVKIDNGAQPKRLQWWKLPQQKIADLDAICLQSNGVVAGLADLFGEFDAQEKQIESAGRPVVAPTRLRDALHALDPHRFSIGRSMTMPDLGRTPEPVATMTWT